MSSTTWLNIFDVTDFRKIADVRDMVSTALQSQYAHSQRYRNMGTVLNENIDMSTDIDNAFTEVMNPQTAKGVFLDWWGYRVGVNRYVTINGTPVRLDDDYFRFLLFYRALSNISHNNVNKQYIHSGFTDTENKKHSQCYKCGSDN